MSNSFERRARRAGLLVQNRRKSTLFADPVTGDSVCLGRRSSKCWHSERRIEAFLRKHEKLGLD